MGRNQYKCVRQFAIVLKKSYLCVINQSLIMEVFALIKIGRDDLILTPEMQARIDEAEKACRDGLCVTCHTKGELNAFLDSL